MLMRILGLLLFFAMREGLVVVPGRGSWRGDAAAIAVGTLALALVAGLHRLVIGVPVLPA